MDGNRVDQSSVSVPVEGAGQSQQPLAGVSAQAANPTDSASSASLSNSTGGQNLQAQISATSPEDAPGQQVTKAGRKKAVPKKKQQQISIETAAVEKQPIINTVPAAVEQQQSSLVGGGRGAEEEKQSSSIDTTVKIQPLDNSGGINGKLRALDAQLPEDWISKALAKTKAIGKVGGDAVQKARQHTQAVPPQSRPVLQGDGRIHYNSGSVDTQFKNILKWRRFRM